MTTSTSAATAASLMVVAAFTSPARAAAFCGSISKAVTACPALATKDAMGEPMAPSPIHPTLVISAVSFCEWWIERFRRRWSSASSEEVDDVGKGVVVADVAGEHHVGGADSFGCRIDGTEDRHHAGEQLADDLCAADAEAADRDVVGGDSALGDDPSRVRGNCSADDLDDRRA